MIGEGDFAAAKAILDTVPNPERDNRGLPSGEDVPIRWELFMLERDFAGAEKVLAEFPGEEFPPPFIVWKTFARARTALAEGDPATARALSKRRDRLTKPSSRIIPMSQGFGIGSGSFMRILAERRRHCARAAEQSISFRRRM